MGSEKTQLMTEMREEMMSKGARLPPQKPATERFDSNCITPVSVMFYHYNVCKLNAKVRIPIAIFLWRGAERSDKIVEVIKKNTRF
jgi:hypothetical protein